MLSFRLGYCLSNLRAVLLGPFCSAYLAIAKRSLSVYCLYFPRLSVSSLLNFPITLSKSTWPNADSSVVIMGDDSSKNNNQIYCLIKFSLFLLCHVKLINKNIRKDKNKKRKHTISFRNWIIINIISWNFSFFISTRFSYERHFEIRPFTKRFLLTEVSAFKKSSLHQSDPYLLLESANIQWNTLRWRVYFFFFLRV